MESKAKAARWRKALKWTIPILLDASGAVAVSYAPPDVLPDLPRDQVPIASNLIIDREGIVCFFTLLDTRTFDARLVALSTRLDELLAADA
jgi:hypothetical protein